MYLFSFFIHTYIYIYIYYTYTSIHTYIYICILRVALIMSTKTIQKMTLDLAQYLNNNTNKWDQIWCQKTAPKIDPKYIIQY